MGKLIHEELSYKIIGAAYEVHNKLGPGFLEKVYENALIHELKLIGLSGIQQKHLDVLYKGVNVGHYVADIVVENKIILEIKAISSSITDHHTAQAMNYLTATQLDVAFVLNFGQKRLGQKRLANTERNARLSSS